MEVITTALVKSFTDLATEAMSTIGSTLPIILPVMGAVVVIGIAVGIFKRFVN